MAYLLKLEQLVLIGQVFLHGKASGRISIFLLEDLPFSIGGLRFV